MRLQTYITEAKTLDANELKRELMKIEKAVKQNKDKNLNRQKDMVADVMSEYGKILQAVNKTVVPLKGKELTEYEKAYKKAFEFVRTFVDHPNTNKAMKLYQKWINVTNGILNKRK